MNVWFCFAAPNVIFLDNFWLQFVQAEDNAAKVQSVLHTTQRQHEQWIAQWHQLFGVTSNTDGTSLPPKNIARKLMELRRHHLKFQNNQHHLQQQLDKVSKEAVNLEAQVSECKIICNDSSGVVIEFVA